MAPRNQQPGPATDNRARMASIGTPTPPSIDLTAVYNSDNVVETRSPEFSASEFVVPAPEGQPAPAPQPAEPPPPAAPAAPAPAPAPAPEAVAEPPVDKYEKMSPEDLRKVVRNQESLMGRHSEEVGNYRKLFDKLVTSGVSIPGAQQAPQPVNEIAKFLKPTLSEEEKQELVALQLTDPLKHEEVQYQRFKVRMDAEERQRQFIQEVEKVRDVVSTPEFQAYERTLPTTPTLSDG